MSLSGSAAEDYNKTGDAALHYDEPTGPGATTENPAGVAGGAAATGTVPGSGSPDRGNDVRGVFSNPMMFNEVFSKLSTSFTDAIHAVQAEGGSGIGNMGKALIARLEDMREEIDGWRSGKGLPGAGGGEKTDQVERVGGGGLYKE